eukprot:TRINITY_DN28905_c0_g1_i1.p1 TRINITY_DN28905_c0_g1~~TRINITY_DN28905_c0_g1_i1.p1  ORF type:complete len:225 (-),score=69.46 TRINITY_DN28905_c0_g1_i1:89-763(-)
MVYKRQREERKQVDSDDSDMDSDEREALEAFKNEGFNQDIVEEEKKRLKKVEEELDAKEKLRAEEERQELIRKKQKQAEEAEAKRLEEERLAAYTAAAATAAAEALRSPRPGGPGSGPPEEWANHPNFKTKLCARYESSGGCSFGDRCGFAHGISDLRQGSQKALAAQQTVQQAHAMHVQQHAAMMQYQYSCLLYTSDAADEEDSVDLGGRRIIKKKKKTELEL